MNYPQTAIRVVFKDLSGRKKTYRVWQSEGKWLWYCLGNSGVANTREQAMSDARTWAMGTGRGVKRQGGQYCTESLG